MKVRDANDQILEERLCEAGRFIVVVFYAHESIPCRHFRPEFEALPDLIEGDLEFWRVDAGENPELVEVLGIEAVPTTVLFRDGDEVKRFEGSYSREALKGRLKDAMLMGK